MTNRTRLSLGFAGIGAALILRGLRQQSHSRDISGDCVLITGGSRGLGMALAARFGREGCRVAICARDADELARARHELSREGVNVSAFPCDVTKRSEVDQMIQDVTAKLGSIDILVNNAGQIKVGPLSSMSLDDFEDAMNVMFWGTVFPALTVLPSFVARGSGHIVNITSIGGKVSIPHLLPYVSAKSAAVGFSEGLSSELAGTGVRVTTIVPGLMRTGSYNAAMFKGDQDAEAHWFSLGASLPGVSMSASRAAGQIVQAVKRGDTEKILTIQASILSKAYAFAPGLTQDLLGFINSTILPVSNDRDSADARRARPGWTLPGLRSPGMRTLLLLGTQAARKWNQKIA